MQLGAHSFSVVIRVRECLADLGISGGLDIAVGRTIEAGQQGGRDARLAASGARHDSAVRRSRCAMASKNWLLMVSSRSEPPSFLTPLRFADEVLPRLKAERLQSSGHDYLTRPLNARALRYCARRIGLLNSRSKF